MLTKIIKKNISSLVIKTAANIDVSSNEENYTAHVRAYVAPVFSLKSTENVFEAEIQTRVQILGNLCMSPVVT